MSRWSDQVLDRLAETVSYELRVTTRQIEWLADNYDCRVPESFAEGEEDAVFEASLIHLRNLDDFLRSKGRDTEIKANDWVSGWNPGIWLDPRVRARIDWNVAHMSALREPFDWRPCEYGAALCDAFASFFRAVTKSCPDRLNAFGTAPAEASRRATKFANYL
jgi:hypothetical protein